MISPKFRGRRMIGDRVGKIEVIGRRHAARLDERPCVVEQVQAIHFGEVRHGFAQALEIRQRNTALR